MGHGDGYSDGMVIVLTVMVMVRPTVVVMVTEAGDGDDGGVVVQPF